MDTLPTYVYVQYLYIWCLCGAQKRVLNSLELDLQMVVSCRVDTGNQPWILYKINKCFLQNTLSSPRTIILYFHKLSAYFL